MRVNVPACASYPKVLRVLILQYQGYIEPYFCYHNEYPSLTMYIINANNVTCEVNNFSNQRSHYISCSTRYIVLLIKSM